MVEHRLSSSSIATLSTLPMSMSIVAVSFTIGVFVSTTYWKYHFLNNNRIVDKQQQQQQQLSRNINNSTNYTNDDDDDEDIPNNRTIQQNETTNRSRSSFCTKNQELPPQSTHRKISIWPWDRLKRKNQKQSFAKVGDNNDKKIGTETTPFSLSNATASISNQQGQKHNEDSTVHDEDEKQQQKQLPQQQQCCIGSIFGLDVGGTLAKLCYFEENNPNTTTTREKQQQQQQSLIRRLPQRRHSMNGRIERQENDPTTNSNDTGMYRSKINCRKKSGHHFVVRRSWIDTTATTKRNPTSNANNSLVNGQQHDEHTNYNEQQHQHNNIAENHNWMNRCWNDNDRGGPIQQEIHSSYNMRRVQSMHVMPSSLNNCRNYTDSNNTNNMKVFSSIQEDDHTIALHRFYTLARQLDTYRAGTRDTNLSFYSKVLNGSFHFIKFETRRMNETIDFIRTHKLHYNIYEMGGTGGGAHKFASRFQQELGITMKKQDELDSVVAGMQFVLSTVIGECYTFRPDERNDSEHRDKKIRKDLCSTNNHYGSYFDVDESEDANVCKSPTCTATVKCAHVQNKESSTTTTTANVATAAKNDNKKFRPQGDEWWWSHKVQRDSISASDPSTYPYLVVTIGTGVSILRVDGPRLYERVSGSTIGGGTYLGLIRLLTDVEDFDDVMKLADNGNPSKVDMMVGDIYGENSDALEKLGLPSNLVASSFGKLVSKDDPAAGLRQEDLARALLLMITNNIGQVAYLNAKIFQTPRIYFVGNFLRHNIISQRRLSYAISYWSKGEMEALFLEHEGYFGALGAFLLAQDISISDISMPSNTTILPKPDLQHRRSATVSHF